MLATWWTGLDRVEEQQHLNAVVDGFGQLFAEVDLNVGDVDILEIEGELLADDSPQCLFLPLQNDAQPESSASATHVSLANTPILLLVYFHKVL